ncbi:hypothetical protein SUSUWATARI_00320 [Serratia phage vB_SmaM-Susuwatari]|nr:hypothetical protein SUSUWATARI_00320 [Serratia phage vB_SmaM-Susuwatari]
MTHCVKPMPVFLVKTGFTLVHPVTGAYMRVWDVSRFDGRYHLQLAVWSMSKRWQRIPSTVLAGSDRVMVLMSDKRSRSGARLRYDKPTPPAGE